MSADLEEIRALVVPVLDDFALDLYDLHLAGSASSPVLKVVVDSERGVDLDVIASASRRISKCLDEVEVISSGYTLEVTSPGVERPLRTGAHFERAIGELANVKYSTAEGSQRVKGRIVGVDDDRVTIDTEADSVEIDLATVTKARTVFEWGAGPRPGGRGLSARSDADHARSDRRGVKERTPR